MNRINTARERIAVIGSGIAGSLTAEGLVNEGYQVTMFEENTRPFSGTSLYAAQTHLGGMYSGSPETARECLHAAIQMKKRMPYALNEQRTASFFVANTSELPLDGYLDFYSEQRDYYASLPSGDHVFGPPNDFFSVLNKDDYPYMKNVEGGIATREPLLDMVNARKAILDNLNHSTVNIATDATIKGVATANDGFSLEAVIDGETQSHQFDQVINASGYNARQLDSQLGDTTEYTLYLKARSLVNLEVSSQLPPLFVVQGDFIHFSPIGANGLYSLISSTDQASRLDSITTSTNIPPEWSAIMNGARIEDYEARQKNIVSFATDNYLKDVKIDPVKLVFGITASFSTDRSNRVRRGANSVVPGWQTLVPTKATNALQLADEAVENALEFSRGKVVS